MGFLGKLFGSGDAVSKTVDGIYNGVDKAFFTEEEKSDHFKQLLTLYEPFKLAQRYMMLIIGIPFVSIHTLAVLVRLLVGFKLAILDGAKAVTVHMVPLNNAINAALDPFNEALATPFILIVGFYFAGGAAEGLVNRFRQKK